MLGAYFSAQLSQTFPTSAAGVPAPAAFAGGFLMLFGARLAGGCTSGHGISGMPLLNVLSVVAVVAMFSTVRRRLAAALVRAAVFAVPRLSFGLCLSGSSGGVCGCGVGACDSTGACGYNRTCAHQMCR